MDKLRAMQLFVRVVDAGSFTAVADEMNVTKSMVSKELRRLEDELGARLLYRSTRGQQLTPIGEGYLQRCRALLLQMDDADAYVQDMQSNPKGKLRINVPMALGITDLSRMFAAYLQAFPDIELDIHLGDESLDLIEHGFDLGFRAASQTFDSNYIGKPLTRFRYQVCAAPQYLARHRRIRKVSDLAQHNCFIYSYFRNHNRWPLNEGVTVSGNLRVNNTLFMRQIIEAGLGIGFLPSFVAAPGIQQGTLKEILPKAERPTLTLYALYPNRQFVQPKLLRCIEFLQQWFQTQPF
ncbi:MAG: LysR family transcriptional regulator [Pseudomonadales bacterium]|jgi:DNA-binding transcriptional LysR family regulator|uniref:LysR family transcriptional regulator n=1 Tax=unclassified Ketobacter TaxID=2639109 RepID=UPI000C98799E|nr:MULTISPECIES: LysR family transcriptional regulator [unclassified Ketobacter]MAQ23989.1 LysR family transcriptional regulator [Pseudomonadales bacterium]MEC8813837.1 LysR family transcriptional regulator [Pseudomonadota bacterium]TNC88498.1 MAG: LysR family transcriptional regulator [Alcanivorax sp.]HAG95816.1 LysR family transcriptional regulator [Gammaproteobacteria bacterium]MCK5790564.1 LysR family transcriptional regulator [Ketobacter sp.]|tara:strand:+ start:338 stop:1219 length:882 start_codon:yes stop_codon:yes gene_type:complete